MFFVQCLKTRAWSEPFILCRANTHRSSIIIPISSRYNQLNNTVQSKKEIGEVMMIVISAPSGALELQMFLSVCLSISP